MCGLDSKWFDDMTMRLVYGRRSGIGAFLIRAASWWDQWNHVGIVTPDDTVIHATFNKGVIEEPFANFAARYQPHEVVEVGVTHPEAGIRFAREQIGCKYDWWGILEFVVRDPLQRRDRWHCVELAETAIFHAGLMRWRNRPLHRITVQQSYMVR